ncbi:MAG: hypothetical protein J0G32_02015 [Alphaproteobacteria bacterium]|nr:hypothetical protein [Alphaproteobacteria bacterium]OJV16256.1 MAG: hypothetical protein BGO27_04525 [Alphaproteobacteria bacterium 33-17]
MSQKKPKFSGLDLVKMTFKESGKRYYRVFKSEKQDDFVDIEGDTSYEAIEKSQVENPFMIKNIIHRLGNFVHKPSLLAKKEISENTTQENIDPNPENIESEPQEIKSNQNIL